VSVSGGDRAPDFIEPIDAWRVWRVIERDGELALASVVKRTIWPVGEPVVAECLRARPFGSLLRRSHAAPDPTCDCGIYAAELERVFDYLNDSLPEARARVLGRVALWGSVIECEHGVRASRAYPLALYVPLDASPDRSIGADEVALRLTRYGVPVEVVGGPRREIRALLQSR
jgi:hypothetical protein